MAFTKFSFIATEKTIMIVHQGKRIQFTKDKLEEFNEIKELLRSGDEDAVLRRLTKDAARIEDHS